MSTIGSFFPRTALCLGFMLLVSLQGISQEPTIEQMEAELLQIDGLPRANLLLQLSEAYLTRDQTLALKYAREARNIYRHQEVSSAIDRVNYLIGEAFWRQEKVDSVFSIVQLFEGYDEKNVAQYARYRLLNGYYFNLKKEPERASTEYLAAMDLFEKAGDAEGVQTSSYVHAYGLFRQGEFSRALSYIKKAVDEPALIINQDLLVERLRLAGALLERTGQADTALLVYEHAKRTALQMGNQQALARVINNIGILYSRKGNLEEAIVVFEEARKIHRGLNNKPSEANAILNMGVAYKMMGERGKSLTKYAEALSMYEALGNQRRKALVLGNMANIYLSLSNVDEALRMYQNALSTYEELGDKASAGRQVNNLGEAYLLVKDYENALKNFKKSLAMRIETGESSEVAASYSNIARVYLELNNLDSSAFFLNKALRIQRRLDDSFQIVHTLIELSKLLRQKEELNNAEGVMDSALLIANGLSSFEVLAKVYEERSEVYKAKGHFEYALDAYMKFKSANDSIYSSDNQSIIAKLQAEYKTKEQKQRIEILERDQQINRLWLIGLIIGSLLIAIIGIVFFRLSNKNRRQALQLAERNQSIQQKSEELETANKHLSQLTNFRNTMTHMIAHDMKNALNTIIGLSESDPFDKKHRQVGVSGRLLLNMVSNMLEVQKFEEAEVRLSHDRFPISQLIEEAHAQVKVLLTMKSVSLQTPSGINGELQGDFNILIRVLVNLLTNAIKYSDPGKQVFINVNTREDASTLHFSVQDEGAGIPEAELPGIFEKYGQVDARATGHASSTGLGLAYCKLAVEAHGGEVHVESELGKGTIVHFSIPNFTKSEKNPATGEIHRENLIEVPSNTDMRSYKEELAGYEVYQIGKVNSVLRKMEDEGLDSLWIARLREAIYRSDEQAYQELLK